MRENFSCFSENAINVVSHPSCSSNANTACVSPASTPSVQNAVSYVYKVTLSTKKQVLVTVSWCKNHYAQGLTIKFGDDENDHPSSSSSSSSSSFKLNMNSRLFRKKKGTKLLESDNSKMEIFWDLSKAKYEATGPEPIDGFCILVMVDTEIALILGDMAEEFVSKKFKNTSCTIARVSLVARQEHCSGNALYSTKAQFSDKGIVHDILIRCGGENEGLKHPVLLVSIDKKTVVRVKRLQWNFRGNQSIFVDGLVVDLLWDVHNWFFNPSTSRYAVFMFRTRSGMDSRLWLEEKMHIVDKEQDKAHEFSLLIYACKSS